MGEERERERERERDMKCVSVKFGKKVQMFLNELGTSQILRGWVDCRIRVRGSEFVLEERKEVSQVTTDP